MFRSRWAVAVGLAMALVVAACGGGDDKGSSEQGRDAGAPQAGQQAGQQAATAAASKIKRGGTLLVALEQNPKDFDPMVTFDTYSQAVVSNVIEGLYDYNEKVEPVPWLAEKVDRPDPVTYVFNLRKGVKFHDGTEMDAEAVKFSMDRVPITRSLRATRRARRSPRRPSSTSTPSSSC